MATVKTLPPTNGAHNPKAETKTQETAKQEVKPQAQTGDDLPKIIPEQRQDTTTPQHKTAVSIDDRFYLLDTLQAKREKYEKTKDCLEKLNKWKHSADGRGDNITLKDASGLTFTTYNAQVVKEFVELLKGNLTAQLLDLDAQITF